MSRILAFTLPAPGHLFPFVPVLEELRDRGHDIVLALPSDSPLEVATDRLFRSLHLEWSIPPQLRQRPVGDANAVELQTFAAYGAPMATALTTVLEQESPDFVLIDPIAWGAQVAAERSATPWGVLAHNPLLFCGKGLDLRGPGLPPPKGGFDAVRYRILALAIHLAHAEYRREVNDLRRAFRLGTLRSLKDLILAAPLILATTAEPFEYPRADWPNSLSFVGPLLWDPPGTRSIDLHSDASKARPLLLVTGSSINAHGTAESWVGKVLDALADEPFRVIATVPSGSAITQASNVEMYPVLSHSDLLPHTACVICHGGPGITQKALSHGVPVVAVPFAYDRFEIARRLEVAAAGVALPLNQLSKRNIRLAIRVALQRRDGAERIARAFRALPGRQLAATAVEKAIQRPISYRRR